MDFPLVYRQLLNRADDQFVLLDKPTKEQLAKYPRAILFVFARWSGSSQLAFRVLARILNDNSEFAILPLLIADTDQAETEMIIRYFGDNPSGAGETYWLVGGEVKHKLAGYRNPSLVEVTRFCHQLLSE